MTELTAIEGVGPARAETLQEAGYETAEDVAGSMAEDLDDLFDRTSGTELIEAAVDEVGVTTGIESVEESEEESESEPETVVVNPDVDRYILDHLFSFVVEDSIMGRRTNDRDRKERGEAVMEKLRDEPPYEFDYEELNIVHRAANNMESEYRSARGLREIVGDARIVKRHVQEKRNELHEG